MTDPTGASRAKAGLAAQPAARINRYGLLGLKAAVLAVLGLMLFFQFQSRRFVALTAAPAMDAAQVARSWAEEGQPVSKVLRPIELRLERGGGTHMDHLNAPLYVAALAAIFRLREADDAAVVTANGLLHLLSALLFYFCTRHVLGSRAAVLGTVLFLSSFSLVVAALDGSGLSLTILLLLAALYAALQLYPAHGQVTAPPWLVAPRRVRLWQAVSGALSGLAFLAGHMSLLLLLPLAWLAARAQPAAAAPVEAPAEPRAARRQRGLIGLATVLGPALLVVVIGSVAFRGFPLRQALMPSLKQTELIMNTKAYPNDTIMMMPPELGVGALRFVATHPAQMLRKVAQGALTVYGAVPQIWGLYLVPLVLLAGLAFPREALGWRLWGVLLVLLVLQGLTIAVYSGNGDDVVVLLPLALLLGTGALWWVLTEHLQRHTARLAVGAVAVLLLTLPYLTALVSSKVVRPGEAAAGATVFRAVNLLRVGSGVTVASDVPEAVVWRAQRAAVELPPDYNSIRNLEKFGVPVGAVFLSSAVASVPDGHPLAAYWRPYMFAAPPPQAIVVVAERTQGEPKAVTFPYRDFEAKFKRDKQLPVALRWPVVLRYGPADKPELHLAVLNRLWFSDDVLLELDVPQPAKIPARPNAS